MNIHKIRITNFKSIYGVQEFDFDNLKGLIKLSGPIGSGKTTLGEAILFGLYGKVKDHKIPNLVAWNTANSTVEIWLESFGKEIYINRNVFEPTSVKIDGKEMQASSKNDYQTLLEEYYDVPKIAVENMCIISFNQFASLAKMNPYQTKCFLDDVFGFKTFTQYNDEVVNEKKDALSENTKLKASIEEIETQIEMLKRNKEKQQRELAVNIDVDALNKEVDELIEKGKHYKSEKDALQDTYNKKIDEIKKNKDLHHNKKLEAATLGKQQKLQYEKFKSGICPTCGHKIDDNVINSYKDKMNEYANIWRKEDAEEKKYDKELLDINAELRNKTASYDSQMSELRTKIQNINKQINIYKANIDVLNNNFDSLINESQSRLEEIKAKLLKSDIEIGQWNEMNELFSKTLRYKLLDTLIPHINSNIQSYINKLEQNYIVKFDQEFKCHIYVDNADNEITYNDLSTGQKKTLDICIIFGILSCVISNVNFSVFFLDELFSNFDADSRNIMLDLIKTNLSKDRSVFVINHAEMADDYFDHKIRVSLQNKKIDKQARRKRDSVGKAIVHATKYDVIF